MIDISFIKELPKNMSEDIKGTKDEIVSLIEKNHNIKLSKDEHLTIYSKVRQSAMDGFSASSYITTNLLKDISGELISIQYKKKSK